MRLLSNHPARKTLQRACVLALSLSLGALGACTPTYFEALLDKRIALLDEAEGQGDLVARYDAWAALKHITGDANASDLSDADYHAMNQRVEDGRVSLLRLLVAAMDRAQSRKMVAGALAYAAMTVRVARTYDDHFDALVAPASKGEGDPLPRAHAIVRDETLRLLPVVLWHDDPAKAYRRESGFQPTLCGNAAMVSKMCPTGTKDVTAFANASRAAGGHVFELDTSPFLVLSSGADVEKRSETLRSEKVTSKEYKAWREKEAPRRQEIERLMVARGALEQCSGGPVTSSQATTRQRQEWVSRPDLTFEGKALVTEQVTTTTTTDSPVVCTVPPQNKARHGELSQQIKEAERALLADLGPRPEQFVIESDVRNYSVDVFHATLAKKVALLRDGAVVAETRFEHDYKEEGKKALPDQEALESKLGWAVEGEALEWLRPLLRELTLAAYEERVKAPRATWTPAEQAEEARMLRYLILEDALPGVTVYTWPRKAP